ncbi:MAG TPA: VWA domain-containing protein [Vicinamibacterales bacterium]|nr:VWA domain-containing protein [Vicinamibacterales bacterium]
MKAPVVLPLVASIALSTSLLADQQKPVFRSEANYVEVTVRVTDRVGKFIDGLTAADFQVREDSRQERVETLFQIDLPTRWDASPSRRTVLYRPDMARALQVAEGRVYLLFMNSVQAQHVALTRRIARDFVDNYLMPEDIVAIWNQSGSGVMFTNERPILHRAIDTFLGTSDILTKPAAGTNDMGRFDTRITSALKWFSSVQGRKKSMLLFSAGWAGIAPVISDRATTMSTQTDLIDRSDVQIYLIDTRGLVATTPVAVRTGVDTYTVQPDTLLGELAEMRWMAEETGGFAITNINTYRDGFKRIVDENSCYYVLGYQSTSRRRPNWDYRAISVKVTKPGLKDVKVQARKGYVAR